MRYSTDAIYRMERREIGLVEIMFGVSLEEVDI